MDKVYVVGLELEPTKVMWVEPNMALEPRLGGLLERADTFSWKGAQQVRDLLAYADLGTLCQFIVGEDAMLVHLGKRLLESYAGKFTVVVQPVEEGTYAFRGQAHRLNAQVEFPQETSITALAKGVDFDMPSFMSINSVATQRAGEFTVREIMDKIAPYRVHMVDEEIAAVEDFFINFGPKLIFTDLDMYYDSFVVHFYFSEYNGKRQYVSFMSLTVGILNLMNMDELLSDKAVAA